MERILALDVGMKKIGIAMTDLLQLTAQPYDTIRSKSLDEQIDKIINIINENSIKKVVVGLPKSMDAKIGPQAEWTKGFVEKMLEKKSDIEIIYIDERYTSQLALSNLQHMSMKKIKQKGLIDTLSAVGILETYLRQKENNVR